MTRQVQLPLPDSPTYFIDRCLGRRSLPQPLRDLGFLVEIHDDHFREDTADEVWIPEVSRRGWLIVSADFRILRRAPELDALRASGGRMVLLSQKLSPQDRVELLVDARFKIDHAIRTRSPPWVAKIGPDRPLSAPGRRRAKFEILG